MKDLSVALRNHSIVMLEALGRIWAVDPPAQNRNALADRLATEMTQPHKVLDVLSLLSTEERAALSEVAGAGGAIRAHLLYREHGIIRPLGPNPMRRLAPWDKPETATEGLYYRGLLFRTYDVLDEYHGEVLFIPPQLMAVLPPMARKIPAFTVDSARTPTLIQSDGDALSQDILTTLAFLRRHCVPSHRSRLLSGEQNRLLSQRWYGEMSGERLEFTRRLLQRTRFVRNRLGCMRPEMGARDWLRASEVERKRALLDAWQDDPKAHELRWVKGIRCESTGWRYDAPASRRTVVSYLALCSADNWISISSFTAGVKHVNVDFLRPNGDYNSWYIRDAVTNEYVTGYENWDRVEGALIRHLIVGPLRWLGIVALGSDDTGDPYCFQVTRAGAELMNLQPMAEPDIGPPPATLGNDFVVRVHAQTNLYDRYQLERFADWVCGARTIDYHVNKRSIWRALEDGIEIEQILAFLRRVTGRTLPPKQAYELRSWSSAYGKLTVRRVVLLQTQDEETMRVLRSSPQLSPLLGPLLNPLTSQVDEDSWDEVIAVVKSLGYWPKIESDGSRRRVAPSRAQNSE